MLIHWISSRIAGIALVAAAWLSQASGDSNNRPATSRQVSCLSFSTDGKSVASGNTDGSVSIWDAATGRLRVERRHHTDNVSRIAFSRDGRTLASGGWDGTIRLWDIPALRQRAVLRIPSQFVRALAFSPDSSTLFSGEFNGPAQSVRRWDVATGVEQPIVFQIDCPSGIGCMDLSRDGKTLASTGHDDVGTVQLWDVANGKRIAILGESVFRRSTNIHELAFTPDSKRLVTWGGPADRRRMRVWDVARRRPINTIGDQDSLTGLCSFVISPKDSSVLTVDVTVKNKPYGALRLWDLSSGRCKGKVIPKIDFCEDVAFSPDGSLVATDILKDDKTMWIVHLDKLFNNVP